MTRRWVAGVVAMVMAGGFSSPAAETDGGRIRGEIRRMCDPVCELKSQDMAFSLLMETYRQFQSYQIDTDYQSRLRQAAGLSDERGSLIIESSSTGLQTLRSFVFSLARQERDLRMAKLQAQVANFGTAYNCVRKIDEESIGITVPSVVNQHTAATKLRNFVIISQGSLVKASLQEQTKPVPASAVLLNAPEIPADPADLIEPCE